MLTTFSIIDKDTFADFNSEENDDRCLDIDKKDFNINDKDAKIILQKISKCKSAAEFQELETKKRDIYIKRLGENGLSIRQISRLTGINRVVIGKIGG